MKKFLAFSLAVSMLLSLAACGSDEKDKKGKKDKNDDETVSDVSSDVNSEDESEKYYDSSRFQKIGSVQRDSYRYYNYEPDNMMYGLVSVDGKTDTGFIYYDCNELVYAAEYNVVRTKKIGSSADLDAINSVAVVDCNVNTVIEGYYDYRVITERFWAVTKVVALNESGTGNISVETSDGNFSYDAEYYVYDVREDKLVDGVKSTADSFHAAGSFIKYGDENGQEKIINVNGLEVPEDARFFPFLTYAAGGGDNGYYKIVKSGVGKVYNDQNELVYTFDTDDETGYGYEPLFMENGYIIASRTYYTSSGTSFDYVILDETFTPVTAVVNVAKDPDSDGMTVGQYNKLFSVHNKLYDVQGNVVYQATDSLRCVTGNTQRGIVDYFVFNDGSVDVVVSKDGKVIYQGTGEANAQSDGKVHAAYRQIGDNRYYYNLKDNDFTIKTNGNTTVGHNLVITEEEDGTKSVVDVRTGEKVFAGYRYYYGEELDGVQYVIAVYENGTSDLFKSVE